MYLLYLIHSVTGYALNMYYHRCRFSSLPSGKGTVVKHVGMYITSVLTAMQVGKGIVFCFPSICQVVSGIQNFCKHFLL